MKEFRFGYADGYIGSPLKLSDGSLTLIGIRRGIERPNKVIVNFSKNAKLTWIDFLRFNVLSATNETVKSIDDMYFTDLLALNEFLKMKDFIENVSHNVQNDEIERINKRK